MSWVWLWAGDNMTWWGDDVMTWQWCTCRTLSPVTYSTDPLHKKSKTSKIHPSLVVWSTDVLKEHTVQKAVKNFRNFTKFVCHVCFLSCACFYPQTKRHKKSVVPTERQMQRETGIHRYPSHLPGNLKKKKKHTDSNLRKRRVLSAVSLGRPPSFCHASIRHLQEDKYHLLLIYCSNTAHTPLIMHQCLHNIHTEYWEWWWCC